MGSVLRHRDMESMFQYRVLWSSQHRGLTFHKERIQCSSEQLDKSRRFVECILRMRVHIRDGVTKAPNKANIGEVNASLAD